MGIVEMISKADWIGLGLGAILLEIVNFILGRTRRKKEHTGLDIDNMGKAITSLLQIVEAQERQIKSLYDRIDKLEGREEDENH